MKLFDLVDETLYREMLEQGYIRQNTNPHLPLFTVGYTEKAQFERKWNDVTINCRGLIVDVALNIIARPWKKFFNVGEGDILFDMNDPVEVTNKMDGSLGILYSLVNNPRDGMAYAIATRGSFESDQAIHATRVWQDKYALKMTDRSVLDALNQYTFLFEIVYPENRIVLDYDGMDDLVLLGAVHTEFGYVIGPLAAKALIDWSGPVTEVFNYKTMQEAVEAQERPNAEGVVIRSGNKMVKLKQTDYMALHKLISNLSEKSVWQQLGQGMTIGEICEALPDEFHGFVTETGENMQYAAYQRRQQIIDRFYSLVSSLPGYSVDEIGLGISRKDFARAAMRLDDYKYMFLLLDNRDIRPVVWEELKPKGDTGAR